jgi:endoglucanase
MVTPLRSEQQQSILRVQGAKVVDGSGKAVVLRGVAFGNQVWSNVRIPVQHHAEEDFARVASLGMNAIRFYLNYRTFESDAEPGEVLEDGLGWLDQNIAWARRHGVYLILNLHVPPGGYQSLGKGKALWTDPTAQDRFIHLWRTLAAHCRGEATIAGYDLLNEPVVTTSIDQWRDLAERAIKSIREVDPEHVVFVERVNSVGEGWKEDSNRNFFRVADPNVVYEFHFYKPFQFTHQGAMWVDFTAEDVRYPDDSTAEVEWFFLKSEARTDGSPRLPPGESPWTFYPGQVYTVQNPAIVVGKPVLTVDRLGEGKAYFDDLVLEQVDGQGTLEKPIWRHNPKSRRGWYLWSADNSGSVGMRGPGRGDESALVATGAHGYANLGSDTLRFRPKLGASYRLSGYMRGEAVPKDAVCRITLELFSSSVPVHGRDKAFVQQELEAYLRWGREQQVPLFLGEWGAIRAAFEGDRGGLRWASDMLDVLLEAQVHFTWHDYHEPAMGLFYGENALPDPKNANLALLDLFRARLKQR